MELAGTQTAATGTVKLRQRRNQHGTNRHVNAHAQGVGTANHLEQTLLSQLLHEAAVLGQHARVVNTDTGTHQLIQRLTEAGPKRNFAMSSEMRSLSSLEAIATDSSAFACSSAAFCEKCTM